MNDARKLFFETSAKPSVKISLVFIRIVPVGHPLVSRSVKFSGNTPEVQSKKNNCKSILTLTQTTMTEQNVVITRQSEAKFSFLTL